MPQHRRHRALQADQRDVEELGNRDHRHDPPDDCQRVVETLPLQYDEENRATGGDQEADQDHAREVGDEVPGGAGVALLLQVGGEEPRHGFVGAQGGEVGEKGGDGDGNPEVAVVRLPQPTSEKDVTQVVDPVAGEEDRERRTGCEEQIGRSCPFRAVGVNIPGWGRAVPSHAAGTASLREGEGAECDSHCLTQSWSSSWQRASHSFGLS